MIRAQNKMMGKIEIYYVQGACRGSLKVDIR